MAGDTDKAEVLILFVVSVFPGLFSPPTVLSERVQREEQPAVSEDPVWDYLRERNLYKSLGPDAYIQGSRENWLLSLKCFLSLVGCEDQGRTPMIGGNNMFHSPSERPKNPHWGTTGNLASP